MRNFFARNLDNRGRAVRATVGLALVIAGFAVKGTATWACYPLVLSGCFVLYEAVRGWCLLRACGIKTRL